MTLFALVLLISCGGPSASNSSTEPTPEAPSRVQPATNPAMDGVKNEARDSALFYLAKIDSATASPRDLQRAMPHLIAADSLVKSSPKYLMQSGLVLLSGEREALYGVNYLIALTRKYPEHAYAPEALMQLALFFDNRLGDTEKANTFLSSLINRYPKHELVPQAKQLLELNSQSATGELETVKSWLKNK